MTATDSSAVREIKFLEFIWDGKLSAKGTPPRHLQNEAHYLPDTGTNSSPPLTLGSPLTLKPTAHHVLVRIIFTCHLALVKRAKWVFSPCLSFLCVLFSSLSLAAKHKQHSINQNVLGDLLRPTVLGTLFIVQMKHLHHPRNGLSWDYRQFHKKSVGTPWCQALRKKKKSFKSI